MNSFIDLFNMFGSQMAHLGLEVALPLGISFYTFQMLGYLIDVRNEDIEPSRDPLSFATYVFFFPKLFAGPVERAQHFLPQIADRRVFNRALAVDGSRQFLWGMFAKVVLAENCGHYVDEIFDNHQQEEGSTILVGACLYMVQLYCDFSGYSNMAIGAGKLFGVTMRTNFRYPLRYQHRRLLAKVARVVDLLDDGLSVHTLVLRFPR
ncbi:MAG: hypothetical protein IPG92_12020 [Flavobacteriales bacterium]|nr:hypothetical protein [Flavobacteriales bacterium]